MLLALPLSNCKPLLYVWISYSYRWKARLTTLTRCLFEGETRAACCHLGMDVLAVELTPSLTFLSLVLERIL